MTTMLSEIIHSLPLRWRTSSAWVETVLGNLDGFLSDHASCERKAHAAAMMLVNRFPEYPELQDRMIGLAREELEHFHQVFRILRQRNIIVGNDEVDSYVKQLLQHVRHPRHEHLLDRLMLVALIEARSCERFCMLADAMPNSDLKTFYVSFAIAESAHFPLFVDTATLIFGRKSADEALDRWLDIEAKIASEIPYRATVH